MQRASAAIIRDGKKILLIKRGLYTEAFPGCWACPGGRAEEGETTEDAVVREVKEEVGLTFKPTTLFHQSVFGDRELFRYLGECSGEVSLQAAELDDYGWFTYEEVMQLPLAFNYKEILEKLHEEQLL